MVYTKVYTYWIYLNLNMQFIWDENKNELNISKHGLSFEEALTAWEDPFGFDLYDEKHSSPDEDRWFYFGRTKKGEIIRVVYTELPNDIYRVITAYSSITIERIYHEQNE